MKNLSRICLFAMILNFVAQAYFCEQRTSTKQLLSMAMLLLVLALSLASFVLGLTSFSREKFRAFIPALICLIGLPAGFVAAFALGGSIKDSRFQRNLPRYTEVVRRIETGAIKPTTSSPLLNLPNQYADLAWAAFPKTNNAGLIIEFLNEGGFPFKHSGYLYVSSGNIESDADTLERWPIHSRINTNWFRISD
jgi:hypothetical protein